MTIGRTEAVPLHCARAELGEGPVWDTRTGALWFVDITAKSVHRLGPKPCDLATWPAPAKVGWVLPAAGGEMIAGLANGLYRFSPGTGLFHKLQTIAGEPAGNRINDGTADARGNVWFGTMDDAEKEASGRFYSFDGAAVRDCGIPPMCITNGPAISPDGKTLYAVDTLARKIMALPVLEGFRLGAPRLFASLEANEGFPDGVSCDAEGGVWLGLWNGWSARRYESSGILTDVVSFPVANITKIALGGADGMTAYATTARKGLDQAALKQQPAAGDIFTFRVRIPGAPTAEARFSR